MSDVSHPYWCGKFFDIAPDTIHPFEFCHLSRPEREKAMAAKDWYEAFADKAHEVVPGWDPSLDLTPLQEKACEDYADRRAIRPECER